MTNLNEILTFPFPLSASDFRVAEQFSSQQQNPEKARQVFLNTLAVRAVNFYCQCLEVETNLEGSYSWNSALRIRLDVADLEVTNRGRLECRPVLPRENIIYVPPEVWSDKNDFSSEVSPDRIGYVAVEIDEAAKKATLLGFIEQVDKEKLLLTDLRSLEVLIDILSQELPVPFKQEEWLKIAKKWLENILSKDYFVEPKKLLTSSARFRKATRSPETSQASVSVINISKARSIKLKEKEFALIFKFTSESHESDHQLNLLIQLSPLGTNILPSGLELELLNESGNFLSKNTAKQNYNFIRITSPLEIKAPFMVKVTLEGESHIESFSRE